MLTKERDTVNFSSGTDEIQSEKERYLETLDQILEEQISSGDMSVRLVSHKMGASQSTLYRKIKNFTGLSPGEYIKEFQLKKAAKYLISDFGNVSEVAYEAGFNNLSYFSKCFKERFGVTPRRYSAGVFMHNNLPEHLTSFVGREQELTDIKELINEHRLINLTGPAGTGKTRLALETLNQVKDNFTHGIFIVHLASLSDPGLIPSAILHELNIKKKPVQSSFENLLEHLKSREVLILLDNFEHLTAAAQDVNTLLRHCPDLTIMITSREKLHLSGEYSYSVSPLSIPDTVDSITDDGITESALYKIKKYSSVRLFLERAETITGNFQLNLKNIPDIICICQYLDGLPLALELAASQIHMFSLHSLAERLKENLSVLKTGDIDRPERHQTLFNAINWSYNLLTEQEKNLFQRLSLFAGSFDINAAEAVWSDHSGESDILDGLRSLVDKNFLQTFEAGGEVRFRLLETLKNYARGKLIVSRVEKEVLTKMAVHFLQMAQKAEAELKGVRQEYWVNRLGMELDNFRGILSALEQYREIELGLQLSTALWRYWNMQNMNKEGCEWLEKMIDLANNLKFHEESNKTNILKGKALSARGIMGLMITENMEEYTEIFRQCITIFRKNDKKKKWLKILIITGGQTQSWEIIKEGR